MSCETSLSVHEKTVTCEVYCLQDAKVLHSSSCAPSDHAHSHRVLRCSSLGLSNSFCMEFSRQFHKTSFVHHLISCFVLVPPSNYCHTHSHGTPPASYDASARRSSRAPVVVVVGTSFSAISVPNTAQGHSDGGIVCVPSEKWYSCDSAFRNRSSSSNVVQAHLVFCYVREHQLFVHLDMALPLERFLSLWHSHAPAYSLLLWSSDPTTCVSAAMGSAPPFPGCHFPQSCAILLPFNSSHK